jgi:hypothetical protein
VALSRSRSVSTAPKHLISTCTPLAFVALACAFWPLRFSGVSLASIVSISLPTVDAGTASRGYRKPRDGWQHESLATR